MVLALEHEVEREALRRAACLNLYISRANFALSRAGRLNAGRPNARALNLLARPALAMRPLPSRLRFGVCRQVLLLRMGTRLGDVPIRTRTRVHDEYTYVSLSCASEQRYAQNLKKSRAVRTKRAQDCMFSRTWYRRPS